MRDQAGEERTMMTIMEDRIRESNEKAQSQDFAGVSCEGESRGVFKGWGRRVQKSEGRRDANHQQEAPPRVTPSLFAQPFLLGPFQTVDILEIPKHLDNLRLARPSVGSLSIDRITSIPRAIISIPKSGPSPAR